MKPQFQTSFGKISFNPNWDNKGQGIFFASNRQVFNNLFYLNLAKRKVNTIANYRGSNLEAVQNPVNDEIALILTTSGNAEVWLAEDPFSKPKRVTRNGSNEGNITWSPKGNRILVTSDVENYSQLFEVILTTGEIIKIPTNISSICTEPNWNPVNSDLVAFTALISDQYQICEFDFSKGKTTILTSTNTNSISPSWANDGRHLFYIEKTSEGQGQIMIIDTAKAGSLPKKLHDSSLGNFSDLNFFYPKENYFKF
jgi:TolB protein